jgi:hypothetical protein
MTTQVHSLNRIKQKPQGPSLWISNYSVSMAWSQKRDILLSASRSLRDRRILQTDFGLASLGPIQFGHRSGLSKGNCQSRAQERCSHRKQVS